MLVTALGVIRGGKVELSEGVELQEGARVLVTVLPPDAEREFWSCASESALASVWDNPQDDIYAQLLKE